ncbi:MAG: roadblock/LC7 domain-containing protein [Planctomycetota bacterium]
MIEHLEKLAQTPGVRFVLLVTKDGVPVASPGVDVGDGTQEIGAHGTVEALAAVATGWLGDLELAVAPASWRAPRRVVMDGSRGSLLMTVIKHSVLVVLVSAGLDLEPVRMAVDGIARRYERGSSARSEPPGPLPAPAFPSENEPASQSSIRSKSN